MYSRKFGPRLRGKVEKPEEQRIPRMIRMSRCFSSNRENFEHPTPNIERRTLKIRLRLRSVASTYLLFSGVSEAMDIPLQLRQNLPVKLPTSATIAPEKLTAYLLVRQARGDKSAFLAKAGYTAANPEQLLHDLRSQVLSKEAILIGRTKFGELYEIRAPLTGPIGSTLQIRSIWMKEHLSGVTKFITLVPDRKK